MNDAIALLAISQLVCLGAIFYLYMQLQAIRTRLRGRRTTISMRARPVESPLEVGGGPSAAASRAAHVAYTSRHAGPRVADDLRGDAASLAARLNAMGVDIPSLARRMQKSEEEVRLLLRRQGAAR